MKKRAEEAAERKRREDEERYRYGRMAPAA
jgi:hypothetical protein